MFKKKKILGSHLHLPVSLSPNFSGGQRVMCNNSYLKI